MNRSFSVGMPKQQSAVVKYECFPDFTRESLTLLAGDGAARVVGIGVLIGLMSATAVAAAAVAGNTGNGVLTLASSAIAAGARPGVYQAICIEPASNAGTFEVFGPDGVSIGTASVLFDNCARYRNVAAKAFEALFNPRPCLIGGESPIVAVEKEPRIASRTSGRRAEKGRHGNAANVTSGMQFYGSME